MLTLALRAAGGRGLGVRVALVGAAVAFLVAYALLEAIAWPAVTSKQKVFWLAAGAIVAGLLLELSGGGRARALVAAHIFPAVALVWLAWRQLGSGPSSDLIINLVALYAASLVVIWTIFLTEGGAGSERGGLFAGALVLIGGFAAGAISLYGAEIGMAQLCIAIGAVMGGALLVSYLVHLLGGPALKFGAIGLVGMTGAWLTCVYVMVLYGSAVSSLALGIVLISFLLAVAVRNLTVGHGVMARLASPIAYGAVVLVPAAAAVAYVILTAEPQTGY